MRPKIGATIALAMALGIGLPGCRTSSENSESDEKALPIPRDGSNITLEEWVKSCEAELANPKTGMESRQELLGLAKTQDCAMAYPAIQKIVDQFARKP